MYFFSVQTTLRYSNLNILSAFFNRSFLSYVTTWNKIIQLVSILSILKIVSHAVQLLQWNRVLQLRLNIFLRILKNLYKKYLRILWGLFYVLNYIVLFQYNSLNQFKLPYLHALLHHPFNIMLIFHMRTFTSHCTNFFCKVKITKLL